MLVVTTWYPTSASPTTGAFVARDVAAIATRHDVRVLHLVAPALADALSSPMSGYAVGPGADATRPGGGAPVERLVMDPRRPDHVLRAARRMREMAAHADVVHTMAISALLPTVGWRPDVPWVHTEHWSGLLAPETLTPALRAARLGVRRLLARPDVVAVVGEELAAGLRRLRTGPVAVVPNIVTSPAVLMARRLPDRDLRSRGSLDVVAVGGLIARKDPVRAVDAVAELRSRGVDAWLTWVGEGPLRERVGSHAQQLGVPLRLTGALAPEQVQGAVADGDVFLLPTRAETFCVAAAEALAAGRPVVVGDTAGPREFVAPPSGRLVVPGAAPGEWADAIEAVWESARGLSAEDVAGPLAARYAAQRHAGSVDAIYRSLVEAGDDPGAAVLTPAAEPGALDTDPLVDVVIATHSLERQVDRAVRSVLDGSPGLDVRVSVVAHDLPAEDVRAALAPETATDPRVRLLELADGIPSPAGPFNHGLEAATAPWVSIMGSDDTLAPGALEGWLAAAADVDPEEPVVVVPPLELGGRSVPTPPVRVGRALLATARRAPAGQLDLVADRLSYRSAPLGLLSRGALGLPGARLLPGARVGEDLPMVTALWSRARVLLAVGAPAYEIHEDAGDRVTYDPRPLADQLRSVDALWELPWVVRLTDGQRRAVATKVLRIHVFGALVTRPDPGWWTPEERHELARVTRRVLEAAPGCADPLSLADHDLLRAALDPAVPAEVLLGRAQARRRHGTPRTLLPSSWRHALHPEAPLRLMAASLAARHLHP